MIALLVLNLLFSVWMLRVISIEISKAVAQLDTMLAQTIQSLIEKGIGEFEPVNPIQAAIASMLITRSIQTEKSRFSTNKASIVASIIPQPTRNRPLSLHFRVRACSAVHNLLNQRGIAHYPSRHYIADWIRKLKFSDPCGAWRRRCNIYPHDPRSEVVLHDARISVQECG